MYQESDGMAKMNSYGQIQVTAIALPDRGRVGSLDAAVLDPEHHGMGPPQNAAHHHLILEAAADRIQVTVIWIIHPEPTADFPLPTWPEEELSPAAPGLYRSTILG